MPTRPKLRFGVVGLDHPHGLVFAARLRQAGGHLVAFHASGTLNVAAMKALGPRAQARSVEGVLDDDSIELVVTSAIPRDRASIAVRALQAGKHVVSDKPGVTTLEELAEVTVAADAAGKRWWVVFGERFENRAISEACRRARLGDIGRVASVLGLGPHRMGADGRPDWFWDPAATGGILVDIGSHQADQFVTATGASQVDVLHSTVGNVSVARHPGMQDIGQMALSGGGAVGTHRVDYLSPTGLNTWGDGRLMIVGTEGTFEVRTNVDVAGRRGKEHLIVTDASGARRLDVSSVVLDWARCVLADVADGTDTFVAHDHVVRVCDITLRAQAAATGWPAPGEPGAAS
jgi:predicted dehydrogenase